MPIEDDWLASVQCGNFVSFTSAVGPVAASASWVRKTPGSPGRQSIVLGALALVGSSANDWISVNARTRCAKRRASASEPGPKTRSSVISRVPGGFSLRDASSPQSSERRSGVWLKLATFDHADEPGRELRILSAEHIE